MALKKSVWSTILFQLLSELFRSFRFHDTYFFQRGLVFYFLYQLKKMNLKMNMKDFKITNIFKHPRSLFEKNEIKKKGEIDRKYYELLCALKIHEKEQAHSFDIISSIEEIEFSETNAESHSSFKFLLNLLRKNIKAIKNGKEFDLNKQIDQIVSKILEIGADPEIKYFVTNSKEEISKSLNPNDIPYIDSILYAPPQPGLIPISDTPEHLKNKSFKIPIVGKLEPKEIEAKYFWYLLHGDIDYFMKLDYYEFYQNYSIPYWIIPFCMFKYYSPNPGNFNDMFARFAVEILHENTKECMLNDPLYYLIMAILKKKNGLPSDDVVSKIMYNIKNKFEAYILISLMKIENIIDITQELQDIVLFNCLNYFEQEKLPWNLTFCVLKKEKKKYIYRQFLNEKIIPSENLSDEEKALLFPFGKRMFKIKEDEIYEIKGEKLIAGYIRAINKPDQVVEFHQGINCLLKAKKFNRVIEILSGYYLRYVTETGEGDEFLIRLFNELMLAAKDNDLKIDDESLNDSLLILKAVVNCLKNIPGSLDHSEFLKVGEILRNEVKQGTASKKPWKSFALRRMVCSILVTQDKWIDYLQGADAVPKDEELTQINQRQCFEIENKI